MINPTLSRIKEIHFVNEYFKIGCPFYAIIIIRVGMTHTMSRKNQ